MDIKSLIVLSSLLLTICYSCGHKETQSLKPSLTISETYTPEEILPGLAMVDLTYDKSSTAGFISRRNSLLSHGSDTLSVDIAAYLKKHIYLSLFRKFTPNERTVRGVAEETSYIGFCPDADTSAVNEILEKAKAFKAGETYRWIPFSATFNTFYYYHLDPDRYSALVVFKPDTKVLTLDSTAVEDIEVVRKKASHFWQWPAQWMGLLPFSLHGSFTTRTDSAIRSSFAGDAVLLYRYDYDRHVYYNSGTMAQINDKASFGSAEK